MPASESRRRMEVVRLIDIARRGGDGERSDPAASNAVTDEVPDPELDGTCAATVAATVEACNCNFTAASC